MRIPISEFVDALGSWESANIDVEDFLSYVTVSYKGKTYDISSKDVAPFFNIPQQAKIVHLQGTKHFRMMPQESRNTVEKFPKKKTTKKTKVMPKKKLLVKKKKLVLRKHSGGIINMVKKKSKAMVQKRAKK